MNIRKIHGFTLIEIMVSMAISSLVIGGIYGVYTIQQKSYTVQEQVTELQQKIRSAMSFMSSDMRMAGYNPAAPYDTSGACDGARIQTAGTSSFSFGYCRVGKSTPTTFSSQLIQNVYTVSNGNLTLQRGSGNATLIAEGVDAIEFRYLNASGNALAMPVADTSTIRTVQISMLVRASYPDPRYTDTILYKPASVLEAESKGLTASVWDINGAESGTGNPANDHYHRRLLITSIQLRNNIL